MTDVRLVFLESLKGETKRQNELECFLNLKDEVTISIKEEGEIYPVTISLNIQTAIKLHKTLRAVINEAKGVTNG
jgi:hypothetical protein